MKRTQTPPHRPAQWLSAASSLAIAAAVGLHAQPTTHTFGNGPNTFTMDFVNVGHPGNPADTTGAPNPAGSVPYTYRIGRHEVSRDMITKASNAGGLGITMADMTSYGGNGANRPATGVSWLEAAAFVNWLNTSTGHQPAYNLVGAGLRLWPSGDAWQIGGENLYRHRDAYYVLASENEWYKAAFYDGVAGVYYNYPTGSDRQPTGVAGGTAAGTVVYGQPVVQGPADITTAGGLSPYGTMGQGGNVWELMESARDGVNNLEAEPRVLRGAAWNSLGLIDASYRDNYPPTHEDFGTGFRVAVVPEPLESAGVIGVAALGFAVGRRRRPLWTFSRLPHLLRLRRLRRAIASLKGIAALAGMLSLHAGSPQNIQATITLDHDHTSIVNRLPTGEGVNEFRGDNPDASAVGYTAGGKTKAALGYNRNILLDGNDSNKVNAGRTAYLDFRDSGLTCADSIGVDLDQDGICDPCVNTTPLLPSLRRFGGPDTYDMFGYPDNFELLIAGEDYDDLQIGCTVDTWARLQFEIGTPGSEGWVLFWGPFATAGADTHNPESPPIQVTRVSLTEWRFQTTGDHRAALYYRSSNFTQEYHGQFSVKFSGKAIALPGQTIPGGSHCDIHVSPGSSGCSP